MITAALALIVIAQNPKTFEELEIAKLVAFHELPTLHEEFEFEVSGQLLKRTTEKDKDRSRIRLFVPEHGLVENINDGSTIWAIMHSQKVYHETKIDKTRKFNPKEFLVKAEEGSIEFKFDSDRPVQFACNPAPKIESIKMVEESGETLRRCIAKGKGEGGQNVTITQWFLPDRWILKRFVLEGRGESNDFSLKGVAKVQDLKTPISAAQFQLDPELIKGYKKLNDGASTVSR